jgi:hypothetical protein
VSAPVEPVSNVIEFDLDTLTKSDMETIAALLGGSIYVPYDEPFFYEATD